MPVRRFSLAPASFPVIITIIITVTAAAMYLVSTFTLPTPAR